MTTNHTTPTVSYTPIADRIIVLRDKAVEKIGDIHLPEQAREKPYMGTVQGVGPKCEQLQPGMRVIFASFAGQPLPDNPDMLLLREDDVMAIAEG